MAARGADGAAISQEYIDIFCKNCTALEVTKLRSVHEELAQENYDGTEIQNEFYDDESLVPWLVAVKAVENFHSKTGNFPDKSSSDQLVAEFNELLQKMKPEGGVEFNTKYAKEMARYSDSQIHNTGAFLGGVAAQEAVKLLIK